MVVRDGNHVGSYYGTRVVVLGASGFIGSWVARSLSAQEANIYLVVRDLKSSEKVFTSHGISGNIIELDLCNLESVIKMFHKVRPSITFNLAGYGVDRTECNEKMAYQINSHLVKTICEAIKGLRVHSWSGQDVVHIGSAAEYGNIGGDLSEDSYPNPTTLYGKSKLSGTHTMERCCSSYGIKGLTARLFTVYGPGEHRGRLLPSLLETTKTGKPLSLTTGKQKRDFTYVEDVVECVLRLGVSITKPGEVVNVATGRLTSIRNFSETAAEIMRIPGEKLIYGSVPIRGEEMEHLPVATGRLNQLISWIPSTTIKEGICKTWDYYNVNEEKD